MRCQGWVFLEQQQPTVELSCETVPAAVRRWPSRHRVPCLGSGGAHPSRRVPGVGPCSVASSQRPQRGTSRLKDLIARIKERFRSFFLRTKIWIRDKLNLKPADA